MPTGSDAIGNFTATHDIKNLILITLTRSTGIGSYSDPFLRGKDHDVETTVSVS